jgi:hypothetical protein
LLAEGGRDPSFATREDGGVSSRDALQARDDLDTGGAGADYCYAFGGEVVASTSRQYDKSSLRSWRIFIPLVPPRRMHNLPLKPPQPINIRPSRIIQIPSRTNQHIGHVLNHLSSNKVLYGNMPLCTTFIPTTLSNLMRELDESVGRVFGCHAREVGLDLGCRSIE